MFELKLALKAVQKRIDKLAKQSPKLIDETLKVAGIQFLTWANNGSPKEPAKPPIKWGFLRGSSSVFLGGTLVSVYEGEDNKDANKSFKAGPRTLTWGWNAVYATRMHEEDYTPGPKSAQDGNAGNKWAEKHLSADKEDLMAFIAADLKKRMEKL